MFDFLSGLGGGLTSILPTFAGLTKGAGNIFEGAGSIFSGFLGDNKPKIPVTMPNIQRSGGNYLLDNMSPEVAGVFQGMGVNPQGFAMQPTQAAEKPFDPRILQGIAQSGLLEQTQPPPFSPMTIPEYSARQQITPVDLQQYYRNLMSNRQGIL
tara:strand:+ start:14 stop:475 length:462 start_codon:yes stop_codon:yes gene_type:complete